MVSIPFHDGKCVVSCVVFLDQQQPTTAKPKKAKKSLKKKTKTSATTTVPDTKEDV